MAIVFFITALLVALASASPDDGYEYPRPERPFGAPIASGQQPFPQFQQPSGPSGYDYNKPAQINPVQPIQPQPVRPQPVRPQPVQPQPRPQPTQPRPVQPQPTRPQPTLLQVVRPQPVQPKPVQQQPIKPQPQPTFQQPSTSAGYDYNKPVQTRPIQQQPIPQQIQPQPVRPQPVQPRPIQPQPVLPQPVRPQPVQPRPIQPQPVLPQPVRPQPVQPRPIQPQPVRPQPIQSQTVRPQPVQPQPQTRPQPQLRPQPQPRPQPTQPSDDGYEYPVPAQIFQERPSAPSSSQFVQAKKPTSPVKTVTPKKTQQPILQQRPNIGGFSDVSSTTPTRISLDIPSRNEYSAQNGVQFNKQQKVTTGYTQAPSQENRFGVTSSQTEGQQIFQTTGPSFASQQTTFNTQTTGPSQAQLTDISTDYSFDIPSQELQDLYQQVVFNIPPKKPAQSAQSTTQVQGVQQQTSTVLNVKPTQSTTSIQPAYSSGNLGYQSPAPTGFDTQTRFNSGVSQGLNNNQYSGPSQQQGSGYTPGQNFQQQSIVSQTYQSQPQSQYQQQQQQVQYNAVQTFQPAIATPVVAEIYSTNLQYTQPAQVQAYQQAVVPVQTFSAVNYQQPSIGIPQLASVNNFAGQVTNYQQQLPAAVQSVNYQQSRPSKVSVEQVASIGYDYPLPAVPFNSGSSSNYQQQPSSNQAVFAQQQSGYNYPRPSRSVKFSAYDYPADSGNSQSYIYKSSVTGNVPQHQEPQQQVSYQTQYPETQKIQPAFYQTSYQYAYQQPQVSYQYEYKIQPQQYQQVTTYQTQPYNYQIKTDQKFTPYQLEAVVSNPILTYSYSTPSKTSSEHVTSQGYQSQIVNNPIQSNIISTSNYQKESNENDFDVSETPSKTLASLDPDLLETIQSLLLKEEIQINNKEKKNAPTENVPFDSYGVPVNQKTVVGVALESFQPAVVVGHLPKPKQTGDYDIEPITVYGPPTIH